MEIHGIFGRSVRLRKYHVRPESAAQNSSQRRGITSAVGRVVPPRIQKVRRTLLECPREFHFATIIGRKPLATHPKPRQRGHRLQTGDTLSTICDTYSPYLRHIFVTGPMETSQRPSVLELFQKFYRVPEMHNVRNSIFHDPRAAIRIEPGACVEIRLVKIRSLVACKICPVADQDSRRREPPGKRYDHPCS